MAVKEKMISIREDQYEKIKALAKKEDRTIRSIIDRMLEQYV